MMNKHNHDRQVRLKQEGIQLHDKDSVTDKEFSLDIQSQENRSIDKVLIIGLGQLGLPVAKYVREKGFDTYGYDISIAAMERAQRIASTKGVPNFGEIDAFIICVSTHKPDDMSTPHIEGLLSVVQEISRKAKNGAIVSIESTIPRGTSKKVFEMLNHRLHVVHVPHRWYALEEVEHGVNQLRVIGGVHDCCLRAALQFYAGDDSSSNSSSNSNDNENRNLGIPLHPVSDIEIAEITKIAENAHRYLQIAFAEDLYLYCQVNNLDFQELRGAVNTKWNVDILEPRDGIGGHCLPKDTKMFLQSSQSSKKSKNKILAAALEVDQDYRRYRKDRGTSFQQNIKEQSNNSQDLRRGDLISVIRHAV